MKNVHIFDFAFGKSHSVFASTEVFSSSASVAGKADFDEGEHIK